ncbi:MAG: alanine dehydrogenase [Flavobacteriales bacterium]|jgi:alanine dehydrogenase|tara:strand:- start:1897 stop:3114 length:1218 start_codon:yes stop_codon:yes gene_type:complete
METGRKAIKALAKEASLLPQEELLQVLASQEDLTIGIPKEISLQEKRVALVPEAVALLVAHGHEVLVEAGAGENSNFTDIDYSESGARIIHDRKQVFEAGIILKVEPPSLDEVALMERGATLISALQLSVQNKDLLAKLSQKKITAIAWDLIRNNNGLYPLVRAMGEIAGNVSVLIAGNLLSGEKSKSAMLGGISGVRPSEIVILGAGTVGEFAARAAMGLGAQVKIFDNRPHRLVRIQQSLGHRVWTSTLQPSVLNEALNTADVAIGAFRGDGSRSPMIVSEPMVSSMKEGSVIIDVCIDRGGCFETSRMTSHESPTYIEHGVIHYCVPNIASSVSGTASQALSNILAPFILGIVSEGGLELAIKGANIVKSGVYMYKGVITNKDVAEERDLPFKDLDLFLATF